MLSSQNIIKIADLGISKNLDNSVSGVSNIGSEEYMSPEAVKNELTDIDCYKTDIWSAGCVIFELIYLEKYCILKNDTSNDKLKREVAKKLVYLLKM